MMTVGEFLSVSTGKQTSLGCDVKRRYQVSYITLCRNLELKEAKR